MQAKVLYRSVRQTGRDVTVEYVDWDLHDIEDADNVVMHSNGCLLVGTVDGNVFIYPTVNVVKIEVTQ
jgi:hypothetical protein